jgi:prophage tail gpP-like protein
MILKIKNKKVDFFNRFTLGLKFDAIASSFSFTFYFDPENQLHKDLIHVGHFHHCSVEHNGETLVTGYLVNQTAIDTSKKGLVSISGYSYGGNLEDSKIPTSIYPLQSDGLTLKEIATKLLNPFNLKFQIDPDVKNKMDQVYNVVTAEASQSVSSYLQELASQKGIVVTNLPNGDVYFTKAKTKLEPFMNFGKGLPGVEYNLTFSGQGLHSEITVMKQADEDGGNAGQSTVKNPFVIGIFRPEIRIQTAGTDIDTATAARVALSEELKSIKLTIATDRWEDINGKVFKPNQIISVTNADILIPHKMNWFIESIDFEGDPEKEVAFLHCVLPEVYNLETPKNYFEEHL